MYSIGSVVPIGSVAVAIVADRVVVVASAGTGQAVLLLLLMLL